MWYGCSNDGSTIIGVRTFAQKGNYFYALHANNKINMNWIVDQGATDHITWNQSLFTIYVHSLKNLNMIIANGSLTRVKGTDIVKHRVNSYV